MEYENRNLSNFFPLCSFDEKFIFLWGERKAVEEDVLRIVEFFKFLINWLSTVC